MVASEDASRPELMLRFLWDFLKEVPTAVGKVIMLDVVVSVTLAIILAWIVIQLINFCVLAMLDHSDPTGGTRKKWYGF